MNHLIAPRLILLATVSWRRPKRYEIQQRADGAWLVVTGGWSAAAAEALARGDADGLTLNYTAGFDERSLGVLHGEWRLRRLDVVDHRLVDLGGLERLAPTLEALSLQVAPTATLPTAEFPALRSITGTWRLIRDVVGRATTQLETVHASEFTERDLSVFAGVTGLQQLAVQQAPYLESLNGVEGLSGLRTLEVSLARRLSDVSALTGVAATLERLEFESCRAIETLDAIASLVKLRYLGFSDCGDIASLHPVEGLQRLEVLEAWGSTRILDGDLTPLTRLPRLHELRLASRRHYRPSRPEILPLAAAPVTASLLTATTGSAATTDSGMLSEAGEHALAAAIAQLAAALQRGQIVDRATLDTALQQTRAAIAADGHDEVWDTAVRDHIAAELADHAARAGIDPFDIGAN